MLCDNENLYSIEISAEVYDDNEIKQWINDLIQIQAGSLSPKSDTPKPISMPPKLKIQNNIDYYKFEQNNSIGGSIVSNLNELTIHVNGSKQGNQSFFKQTLYPMLSNQEVDLDKVICFIHGCKNRSLKQINIIGNLFSLKKINHFIQYLVELNLPVAIYMNAIDFLENRRQLKKLEVNDFFSFKVLFEQSTYDLYSHVNRIEFTTKLTNIFLVFSEQGYQKIDDLIQSDTSENDYQVLPIFNGENLNFFKSYVFLNEKDVKKIKLSKRHIFIRHSLNVFDFGKLTILPDGKIYSNINEEPLGTLDDKPYDLVYKEFVAGKSWLNTRKDKPCNDCLYQYLCPSPSAYERAIGQSNLCTVYR